MITQSCLLFRSEEDALLVAEQLPQSQIMGNQVSHWDRHAFELAIALANIDWYMQPGAYSKLPYPEHERAYNGDSPRIYVRCLSAYSHGLLHGLWIDATQDVNEIWNDLQWMLSWSPMIHKESCEEWAIHNYEGFSSFELGEYRDLETITNLANGIQENGEVFAQYINCEFSRLEDINDWNELAEKFSNAYVGHYKTQEDFAESDEIREFYNFEAFEKQFPFWAGNINWKAVATDLFCGEYYSTKATGENYGIHVFRNL